MLKGTVLGLVFPICFCCAVFAKAVFPGEVISMADTLTMEYPLLKRVETLH
jgi:hypothetical protein